LVGNSSLLTNTAQFGSGIWLQDNVGASVTFGSGGQLASSNSAVTGTLPPVTPPLGMAINDGLLQEPGAPDPEIPAAAPVTSGSRLSLPDVNLCGAHSSRTHDAGSYLRAIAVASTVDARPGASAKPTGVRPLRASAQCPGSGSPNSGNNKPVDQATMC
jgi:hypothetical protein